MTIAVQSALVLSPEKDPTLYRSCAGEGGALRRFWRGPRTRARGASSDRVSGTPTTTPTESSRGSRRAGRPLRSLIRAVRSRRHSRIQASAIAPAGISQAAFAASHVPPSPTTSAVSCGGGDASVALRKGERVEGDQSASERQIQRICARRLPGVLGSKSRTTRIYPGLPGGLPPISCLARVDLSRCR